MNKFILSTAALLLILSVKPVHAAEKIGAPHVYQVVENIVSELALLLDANFSDTKIPAALEVAGKRPRHVMQKGQEVLTKLRTLKYINGAEMKPIDTVLVHEITPGDVKKIVDRILVEIRSLKPNFKVTREIKTAALDKSKKPNDVYKRLDQASKLVSRLDIPGIVPNDVYQSALAIISDIKQCRVSIGATAPEAPSMKLGKKPSDAYAQALKTLKALKVLSDSNKEISIPGGIALPPAKTGQITPGDVLEIQTSILAEISSIKVKFKTKPTEVIAPVAGKTPSDVFWAMELALSEVAAISSKIQSNK